MQLPNHLVSLPIGGIGWLIALASLAWAVRIAPWPALRAEPMRIHLVLLAVVFLTGMWTLSATLMPGLTLHFLGVATVTLVIGLELTLIAGLIAAILSALLFGHGLAITGWTFLLSAALPAAITYGITRASQRFLPPNFFIYLFIGVFLSAVLGVLAHGGGTALLVMALGLYDGDIVWNNYLRILPLLAFSEGVINGMLMTALALVSPQLVISFDDHHYIDGR
ncbi:energy-coupling factor ABC transporter permease [Guyparkeria sp. TX1]|uniref:energy-coupling factor ABC transporter permease n=1 Tax=Guyparkeria sp. TX1 TaxID=3115001 RepID=UPI0039775F5A